MTCPPCNHTCRQGRDCPARIARMVQHFEVMNDRIIRRDRRRSIVAALVVIATAAAALLLGAWALHAAATVTAVLADPFGTAPY